MKNLLILLFSIIAFSASAQLTLDQKATISQSSVFLNRVQQVLLEKASYWTNAATPLRADINVQMQKRKVYAKYLLSNENAAVNARVVAGNFWLTINNNPTLDGGGIPTAVAISDAFDSSYDFLAGVRSGDSGNTDIDWK